MVIVSITPEIALEKSVNYAGGLGVLAGDKFYAAGDMGLDYLVLSLFYRHGYVKIDFLPTGEPRLTHEEASRDFFRQLHPEGEFTVKLRNMEVHVIPWSYEYRTAKAVLFEAMCPEWARKLNERVYIEDSEEEKFYKYALLAKAAATYLREFVGLEKIYVLDLEESYTSLVLYELKELIPKARIVIHTPGPWGHPTFPGYLIKQEFGIDVSEYVNMTEETLGKLSRAIVVSKKQKDIISRIFPKYEHKIISITNGVYLDRWMHPRLRKALTEKKLSTNLLKEVRSEAKEALSSLIRQYKHIDLKDKLVVTWARRLARYKRPYFVMKFVEEYPDLTEVVYVISGKPHPKDPDGLNYLNMLRILSQKYKNVVYIPDYNLEVARLLLQGSDIWLFTPFSGWEACGTSYMKALINGVPVVSSKDGGVLEVVRDGYNGWLFGDDIRELINIYNDPRAKQVDAKDYEEFKEKVLSAIDCYFNKPDEYWEMALNAAKETPLIVDIKHALRSYYGNPALVSSSKNN